MSFCMKTLMWRNKRFKMGISNLFASKSLKNKIRQVNYSRITVSAKPIGCRTRIALPYVFKSNLRFQHVKVEAEEDVANDLQKFHNLLKKIDDNENDLSVNVIGCIINEMQSLLPDIYFEEHHSKSIQQNQSFRKLFKAIDRSINDIPENDLIEILKLCKLLGIPLNSNICSKIIKNLYDEFENLDFSSKVYFLGSFYEFIHTFPEKERFWKHYKSCKTVVVKSLKERVYLNSSKDTVAAFSSLSPLTRPPMSVKAEVLRSIFDLDSWDDWGIFKFFLEVNSDCLHSPLKDDLNNEFLLRMKEEIRKSNKLLRHFLLGYTTAVEKNIVGYDEHLIDNALDKIVFSRIKTPHINNVVYALSKLRHYHDGFIEYLIDWLRKNPNIFSVYPTLSRHIIAYIASCNCNCKGEHRWTSIMQPILKNNLDFKEMFKFYRNKSEDYFYLFSHLASIHVFVDEEIEYLSTCFRSRNDFMPAKYRFICLELNQMIKLFYPSFPKCLLTDEIVSLGVKSLQNTMSKPFLNRVEMLQDFGKCLEMSSGVRNCVLTVCMNKFGVRFDVIVGMNKEGQLYSFKDLGHRNQRIFIEDIRLPSDFQIVNLLFVDEKRISRNSLHLDDSVCMKYQISEKLGLPAVVIRDVILKNLNRKEIGDYIYQNILEKVLQKKEAGESVNV